MIKVLRIDYLLISLKKIVLGIRNIVTNRSKELPRFVEQVKQSTTYKKLVWHYYIPPKKKKRKAFRGKTMISLKGKGKSMKSKMRRAMTKAKTIKSLREGI